MLEDIGNRLGCVYILEISNKSIRYKHCEIKLSNFGRFLLRARLPRLASWQLPPIATTRQNSDFFILHTLHSSPAPPLVGPPLLSTFTMHLLQVLCIDLVLLFAAAALITPTATSPYVFNCTGCE